MTGGDDADDVLSVGSVGTVVLRPSGKEGDWKMRVWKRIEEKNKENENLMPFSAWYNFLPGISIS